MVTFGATADIFVDFNTYEALFWIFVSILLFIAIKFTQRKYTPWLYFNTSNLFLFGVTDVVELYTGGFLHTALFGK